MQCVWNEIQKGGRINTLIEIYTYAKDEDIMKHMMKMFNDGFEFDKEEFGRYTYFKIERV